MALVYSDERPKRILNAFGSLFNAVLAAYLGIVPLVRERKSPFVTILVIVLITLAGAVSAVILAFFDGYSEIAATKCIPLLVGAAQNYMFTAIRGARNLVEGHSEEREASDCYTEGQVK